LRYALLFVDDAGWIPRGVRQATTIGKSLIYWHAANWANRAETRLQFRCVQIGSLPSKRFKLLLMEFPRCLQPLSVFFDDGYVLKNGFPFTPARRHGVILPIGDVLLLEISQIPFSLLAKEREG
jgi:hypothetical protein